MNEREKNKLDRQRVYQEKKNINLKKWVASL